MDNKDLYLTNSLQIIDMVIYKWITLEIHVINYEFKYLKFKLKILVCILYNNLLLLQKYLKKADIALFSC